MYFNERSPSFFSHGKIVFSRKDIRMRFLTWVAIFIVALLIALALVLTFTQPEFKTSVGASIFAFKTPQWPVYWYVAGAFVIGLFLGVFQAVITFFRTRAEIFRKNRQVRELEEKVADLERQIDTLRPELTRQAAPQPPPSMTATV
jgi:uncharacterized integral membrane protein